MVNEIPMVNGVRRKMQEEADRPYLKAERSGFMK
jgi:hypothetical protein